MPRLPCYVLPGHPQHVMQRGNNRCPIFIAEEDYGCFRHHLREACDRHDCRIHAYVLMTNHVHLVMTANREDSHARVLQSVGRRYVQYFNTHYRRTGTLSALQKAQGQTTAPGADGAQPPSSLGD